MKRKVTLPNDYERMIPEYHTGTTIYGEHMVRYEGVRGIVKGKIVLDIASGSGYGTQLLAKEAKKIYGVDVSSDSIAYAEENYGGSNIEYIVGDGEKIPLKDGSVDVVISFETIEHIKDYKRFMSEVRRILKKDGLLVLSTPNDIEFAEGNHFHLHEFEQKELEDLIHQYFAYTKSYYQGTWLYNALLDGKGLTQQWKAPIITMQTAPITLKQALYFYILCSSRAIKEYVEPIAAISGHWSERNFQEQNKTLHNRMDKQEQEINHLSAELSRSQNEINAVVTELNRVRQELMAVNRHILVFPYRAAHKIKRVIIQSGLLHGKNRKN